jgi:lipopolysaccharide transport system permease protein
MLVTKVWPTAPPKASVPAAPPEEEPGDVAVTVIEPRSGWDVVDLNELWQYRDLLWFLIWKDIKARYAQSTFGVGWAVAQPLASMLVFTLIFGRLAKMDSDGAPYALFALIGLVPWTYFSTSLTGSSSSLLTNSKMISKVYFPRLVLPLAAVLGKLVDFAIAMGLVAVVMLYYRTAPNAGLLVLPILILLMMLTSLGIGTLLTALAIQYRDVKHGMAFAVRMLMYAAPVVYSTSDIQQKLHLSDLAVYAFALNPMVGVIEGFRAALLGTRPMPWDLIAAGSVTAVTSCVIGCLYFRSRERLFADVA